MFLTLMWLAVAAGMGVIITAAIREQDGGVCNGYDVKIEGFKDGMLFTSKDQIVNLLKTATKGDITGQRKTAFNLPMIEDLLEQSSWVYNADLYFDNNNVLHANVTERKPLARVFTDAGTSFYIDEAGKQIPLSEKISLDLPVFTGYPSKKILNTADSSLIQNVIATASFINGDPFWNAQVAQIDINNCGKDCWNMEMIPVVGDHKVELGDGSDIAGKFHRLYLFYDQVLKRTGFDKYQKIDVEYNGQVIGIKGDNTKVDSIQLRKNIEELLRESRESNEMLQVAPSIGYVSTTQPDISSDSNFIYSNDMQAPVDSVAGGQEDINAVVPAIKPDSQKIKPSIKKEVIKKEVVKKKVVADAPEKTVKVEKKETSAKTMAKEKSSPKPEEKRNVLLKTPDKTTGKTVSKMSDKKSDTKKTKQPGSAPKTTQKKTTDKKSR